MTQRFRSHNTNPFKDNGSHPLKQVSKARNCSCPECGKKNVLTAQEVNCGQLCYDCEDSYNEISYETKR